MCVSQRHRQRDRDRVRKGWGESESERVFWALRESGGLHTDGVRRPEASLLVIFCLNGEEGSGGGVGGLYRSERVSE